LHPLLLVFLLFLASLACPSLALLALGYVLLH
ncbi:hypothetical protein A2U01_0099562, partial [Trifolium medium]|nr:hypothetical protein [Trifolium medium]